MILYDEPTTRTKVVSWCITLFILLLIWVINPITAIPSPKELYDAFIALSYKEGSGNLYYNIFVTLKLQIVALLFSSILSLILSYIGRLSYLKPVNKIVELLRYIPIVGFTLIFYSFFAIGFNMKVAMLTIGYTFFLTTSMNAALDEIPKLKYELAKTLGMSEWRVFTTVVFFPSLPAMLRIIMQNAAMGWLMITAVETFNATDGGMGRAIQIYSSSNQTANTYVYLVCIGVIAAIEDFIFKFAERILWPYTQIKERG